jgi:type I restriction enzyme M protein
VVVPTGFITAQSGIDKAIRTKLVDEKMLAGVVSMPSNIFATTGTNVSILFIDKGNKDDVVLIDASSLGETVKDGKNQKTVSGHRCYNCIIL